MPLSLLDMIHNYWPLGSGQVCNEGSFITCIEFHFRKFCVNWAPHPSLLVSSSAPTQSPSSQLTGKLTKVTTFSNDWQENLSKALGGVVFVTFLKHKRVRDYVERDVYQYQNPLTAHLTPM